MRSKYVQYGENNLICLIKFGESQHMNTFLNEGTMFFRRLKDHRNHSHPERHDPNEGVSHVFQPGNVILKVNDDVLTDLVGPIIMDDGSSGDPLIYCMYWIGLHHQYCTEGNYIDQRCFAFGDTAVVITDVMKFYDRLIDACKKLKVNMTANPIEYVDRNSHNGDMGPFRKFSDEFEHQSEFRAVLKLKTNDTTYKLNIGSIADIAHIVPAKEVNSIISIEP